MIYQPLVCTYKQIIQPFVCTYKHKDTPVTCLYIQTQQMHQSLVCTYKHKLYTSHLSVRTTPNPTPAYIKQYTKQTHTLNQLFIFTHKLKTPLSVNKWIEILNVWNWNVQKKDKTRNRKNSCFLSNSYVSWAVPQLWWIWFDVTSTESVICLGSPGLQQ